MPRAQQDTHMLTLRDEHGSMTDQAELIRAPSASAGYSWTDRRSSDPLTGGTPMLPSARGSDQVPDMSDITLRLAHSRAA